MLAWILTSLDPLQVAVDGLAQADGEDDCDHLDGREQDEGDEDGVEVQLQPRRHAVVASLKRRAAVQESFVTLALPKRTFRK